MLNCTKELRDIHIHLRHAHLKIVTDIGMWSVILIISCIMLLVYGDLMIELSNNSFPKGSYISK